MMSSDYLKKAKGILKEQGFASLIDRTQERLNSLLYYRHTSIWFMKDLYDESPRMTGFGDYRVTFDDFDRITQWQKANNSYFPWMYSENEIAVARQFGHIIPFLSSSGKIVGYTKVAINGVYIRDYDTVFPLAQNKAMFYDTTVLPEFRGKKLPHFLKTKIFRFLKERNIRFIFAHIEPWNIASIKSNTRLGFKEVFTNRFTRIICFKFHSNNPANYLS